MKPIGALAAVGGAVAVKGVKLFPTLVLFVALAGPVNGVELLQNSDFANGLHPWKTNPAHGDWDPLANTPGEANLHPDRPQQRGDVVYQPVNVTGIANVTVTAACQMRMNYLPNGAASPSIWSMSIPVARFTG